jgi:hypothetical protein
LKGKKKHIRVLGLFSEPPFISFFLSPRAASASWRVIYNRWKGPQHRGGKLLMSFSILPLSLSLAVAAAKVMLTNQVTNRPNLLCRLALFSFFSGPGLCWPAWPPSSLLES